MRLPSKVIVAATATVVAGVGALGAGTGSARTGAPASAAEVKCSVYRGDVKTLGDPAAANISDALQPTSVKALRNLPNPHLTKNDSKRPRMAPVEQTIYRMNVKLVSFKLEKDNDIHVIVAGPVSRKRMIVEFVLPECGKRRQAQMANARFSLQSRCGVATRKFQRLQGTALITGVGFYDDLHRQKGAAPNGIELHPVLSFQFTSLFCTHF